MLKQLAEVLSLKSARKNKEKILEQKAYENYLRSLKNSQVSDEVNQLINEVQDQTIQDKHAMKAESIMNELADRCDPEQALAIHQMKKKLKGQLLH